MRLPERLPYPGLRAYTREESDLFFGREGCVDAMIDRLAATRFLAVLGPSGSGKSSLVRTGLLDALDLGLHPQAGTSWRIADLHPGGQPMRKLAAALLQNQPGTTADCADVEGLAAFLRRGPRSVVEWVNRSNVPPGSNLLILVDQFEELFRYGDYAQREEAEAFVALLLESSSASATSIHVVITMRSEYLGACASIPDLAERISAGLYLTPRMNRDQCEEAIRGPADVLGFRVETALVNRLLNDLGSLAPWETSDEIDLAQHLSHQADQLPLMQHVLNRLWVGAEAETDEPGVELKLADYDRIGGLAGALDAHGDEVMATLGPARSGQVEAVFRSLVSGTSASVAVRRACRMGELIQVVEGARADVVAIIEAFRAHGCNFIRTSEQSLASDDVIIDISHESLIRQWTPLRGWLEKEARSAAAWRRLVSAQKHYSESEGGLLTGLDLHNLVAWWGSTSPTPVWASRHGDQFEAIKAFLEASQRAEESQAEAELRHQIRERNRLRLGVAGLLVALAVVAGLGIWAFHAKQEAERQHHVAEEYHKNLDTTNAREIENAKSTAAFMDDVSNLIYSDRYKSLLGVSGLQSELMEALVNHQTDSSRRHSNGPNDATIVRDEYRLGLSYETLGKAADARDNYAKAHEDGLKTIQSFPAGHQPPESLLADFIGSSYRYAWFLFDIGDIKKGEEVMEATENAIAGSRRQAPGIRLLVAYAQLENLKSRYYHDHRQNVLASRHSLAALELAKRAVAKPDANLETISFAFHSYRNRAIDVRGAEAKKLNAKACTLVEKMKMHGPADVRYIQAYVECLRDQAEDDKGKNLLDLAQNELRRAHDLMEASLRVEPNNQSLLLSMAGIEIDVAFLSFMQGNREAQTSSYMAAKDNFVRALEKRTLFQSDPTQVKLLYTNFKFVDFPKSDKDADYSIEELKFYRDVVQAIEPSVNAFPNAASFTYVAADASAHVGQLLRGDPTRAREAENYLSSAVRLFDKIGAINDLSNFSEDFAAHCGAYRNRAELYSKTGRPDLMLADIKKLRDSCTPALNKYPWDFYLRQSFVGSAVFAGKTLLNLHRYGDALPYLEYASSWGVDGSSKLLAQMYRERLGVSRDEAKAKALEELARKQSMKKFTVPADFSGTKAPFYVYVKEWPSDYPFEGIDDQAKWLKEARGGTLPAAATEAFRKLHKIARENNVSFPELCAYALDGAIKDNEIKEKTKQIESARKKLSSEPTAKNLETFKTEANELYKLLMADQEKQSEAVALEKELVEKAENLVKENPGTEAYRIAWTILVDHGNHLASKDRLQARYAYARSAEVMDFPPEDNVADLNRRSTTYERLGDLDSQDGRIENARQWYSKEVEVARKRYGFEVTAGNLESLNGATFKLYLSLVKLAHQGEGSDLLKSLTGSTEMLLRHSQTAATLEEAILVYTELSNVAFAVGNRLEAARNLTRAQELALKITDNTSEGANSRYRSFEMIGGSLLKNGNAADARTAYLQASLSLERYIAMRTAAPHPRTDEYTSDISSSYGSLSFMYVLAGNFSKAVEAARQGLEIKPDAAWIEANLAHALLLSGKQQEAVQHYMNARKGTINERSILDATREDFEMLKGLGFGHPAMDGILKQMAAE